MTNLNRLLFSLLFASLAATAIGQQLRLGLKGGISTHDLGTEDAIEINDGIRDYQLKVEDAKYGYHLGLVLQLKLASFILQPECVFNSNSVDFSFGELGQVSNVFSEKYQNLDIPVLLGLSAGPMRLMAGPVGHYFLSSSSELAETIENYRQNFENLTYGYQAGIGIDFLNVMIDVRYEGNFNKFGDHIVFADRDWNFSKAPTRLLASIALAIK